MKLEMRIAFFGLIIHCFCFQTTFSQQIVRKEELSIYALVIRDVRRLEGSWAGKARKLLVLSKTMKGDKTWVETAGRSTRGIVKNFARENNQSLTLPDNLATRCRCELISETELKGLLDQGAKETEIQISAQKAQGGPLPPFDCSLGWKYFDEKFPEVNQYYKLSRIGYSANRKFAFIETEGVGACSSSNWTHLLKRTRRGWKVYRRGGGSHSAS